MCRTSHPAIIKPDEFDTVQLEMERRKRLGRPVSCHSPFSAKIICGECGGFYGSRSGYQTPNIGVRYGGEIRSIKTIGLGSH